MENKTITYDFHHSPFNGGFDLVEDPDVSRIGFETSTLIFSPNEITKNNVVVLVPGIGINKNTVQGSFTKIAEKISVDLGATTAISVEGEWDNKSTAGFPETGIAVALRNTLSNFDGKMVHLVGFSHNSTNLLTVASFKDIVSCVSSITLLAPTDTPFNIVNIFRDGGRRVNTTEQGTRIGNRETLVPSIISSGSIHPAVTFDDKLIRSVNILKKKGISITILHGGDKDSIVPPCISENLSDKLGLPLLIVKPEESETISGYDVHNFASNNQLRFLISQLKEKIE